MVSADNLNLDVLELIFAHLSGDDLVSIALVSKSFLAGVIPRLYHTVLFRARHAKKYASFDAKKNAKTSALLSPFVTLRAHPDLAIHVRCIGILAAPLTTATPPQIHPHFLSELATALTHTTNLASFACLPRMHILPPILRVLRDRERLVCLRVSGALSTAQCALLMDVGVGGSEGGGRGRGLSNVTLDFPSWNVVDILPRWTLSLQQTLTSLTIFNSPDLHESILDATVAQLPRLRGLHVIGCPKIGHASMLQAVMHTPLLEDLSLTIIEPGKPNLPQPVLPHLRHLSIDARTAMVPAAPDVNHPFPFLGNLAPNALDAVLRVSSHALRSLTLRLSERHLNTNEGANDNDDQTQAQTASTLWDSILSTSLTHLALMDCTPDADAVRKICTRCSELKRLEVAFPVKDVRKFTLALAQSQTLHTLIDTADAHATHGSRVALTPDDARFLMNTVPSLRRVVSDGRMWMGAQTEIGLMISLQRHKPGPASGNHWFHPCSVD
ncbi:hypothetical protein BJ138DRAFT_558559 [Hygrophoropsis aurantiaca]|uniref:Uncharacterized protein n=1 Tax=Hygrophoropsis aurantiaca TaxID=72124 RepID=A0ACB8A2T6_9AGAM|nr:hypothetical protein BJ138DRAFT_558559 [Hygrophoropsis aurantiaca]